MSYAKLDKSKRSINIHNESGDKRNVTKYHNHLPTYLFPVRARACVRVLYMLVYVCVRECLCILFMCLYTHVFTRICDFVSGCIYA